MQFWLQDEKKNVRIPEKNKESKKHFGKSIKETLKKTQF